MSEYSSAKLTVIFHVIYLPFCSVNLTWKWQSIPSDSQQNTHQSSSGCRVLNYGHVADDSTRQRQLADV